MERRYLRVKCKFQKCEAAFEILGHTFFLDDISPGGCGVSDPKEKLQIPLSEKFEAVVRIADRQEKILCRIVAVTHKKKHIEFLIVKQEFLSFLELILAFAEMGERLKPTFLSQLATYYSYHDSKTQTHMQLNKDSGIVKIRSELLKDNLKYKLLLIQVLLLHLHCPEKIKNIAIHTFLSREDSGPQHSRRIPA